MRFSSLKHVPAETRKILRDRFDSLLRTYNHQHRFHKQICLSDQIATKLFSLCEIKHRNNLDSARAHYDQLRQKFDNILTFDELIEAGWIRVVQDRIFGLGYNKRYALSRVSESQHDALVLLFEKAYSPKYSINNGYREHSEIAEISDQLEKGVITPDMIGCLSPQWVAARLWEQQQPSLNKAQHLTWWIDRWDLLGRPRFTPSLVWKEQDANRFIGRALLALKKDQSLLSWDGFQNLIKKQNALIYESYTSRSLDEIPTTLLGRYFWLHDRSNEDSLGLCVAGSSAQWSLFKLLLEEASQTDYGPVPNKIAKNLFKLAVERPEALKIITSLIQNDSRLMADLVLFPPTSALACAMIAQWPLDVGAWDRDIVEQDYRKSQVTAFADAVGVMGHFLERDEINPAEVGALLVWMHQYAIKGFIGDQGRIFLQKMLASFRECLFAQEQEILMKIYEYLEEPAETLTLNDPRFIAAIDIVIISDLVNKINPSLLIQGYITSIQTSDHFLSVHQINQTAAAILIKLAQRTSDDQWQLFLRPINIKSWLQKVSQDRKDIYSIKDAIARALRAHIRVLCRAVSAWGNDFKEEVFSALIDAIEVGATSHEEKGKVSAFSARYENKILGGLIDQPIANDLTAALKAIQGEHQEKLLGVILEIDEPMVLAQTLKLSPKSCRAKIEEQLNKLSPEKADDIWSLTDVQNRIDALLNAGVASVAAKYIDEERGFKTLGRVPGRITDFFRTSLRLNFIQGEWEPIFKAQLPPDLPQDELVSARDSLDFYKALAELSKPNGRPEIAATTFENLCRRQSHVPAYLINLFAARITIILAGNIFAVLTGEKAVEGHKVLADMQRRFSGLRSASENDQEIFNLNKALLLLALGQANTAKDLLSSIKSEEFHSQAVAYTAVALFRSGATDDALARLEREQAITGETGIIEAALAHIKENTAIDRRINLISDEDFLKSTYEAYSKMLRMTPDQQASVVHPEKDLGRLIFYYVQNSTAGIVELVPIIKTHLERCDYLKFGEDDWSALLHQILIARFKFLGWSVEFQPPGMYSANGNIGKRDIQIKSGNATLATIEALRCEAPVSRQTVKNSLSEHFQRLVSYSTCLYFIHLTYCYLTGGIESILDELKIITKDGLPPGITYITQSDILVHDSSPTGFEARYKRGRQEIVVWYMVIDMEQTTQFKGAAMAGKTRRRKASPKESS